MTKTLQIAKYLAKKKRASIYTLQRLFYKNNPANVIMSLRNLYGWTINVVQVKGKPETYKEYLVIKVGKMPLR